MILLLLGYLFWRRRMRKQLSNLQSPEPALIPEPWIPPSEFGYPSFANDGGSVGLNGPTLTSQSYTSPSTPMKHMRTDSGGSRSMAMYSHAGMPISAYPGPGAQPLIGSTLRSLDYNRDSSFMHSTVGAPSVAIRPTDEWGAQPDIIIQHRDGGTVEEVPPPYLNRSNVEVDKTAAVGANASTSSLFFMNAPQSSSLQ